MSGESTPRSNPLSVAPRPSCSLSRALVRWCDLASCSRFHGTHRGRLICTLVLNFSSFQSDRPKTVTGLQCVCRNIGVGYKLTLISAGTEVVVLVALARRKRKEEDP